MKIFKPELFQGHLKKKNYFEGWYYKHVSSDLDHVYAFIPGISLTESDSHAFIQIIDGISGKTNYIPYPLEQFSWKNKQFAIKIGESEFSKYGMKLLIRNESLQVSGEVTNTIFQLLNAEEI